MEIINGQSHKEKKEQINATVSPWIKKNSAWN